MGKLIFGSGLHRQQLDHLLATTHGAVRIASAYVTESDLFGDAGHRDVRLLTALTIMDIVSGATSLNALKRLMNQGVECRVVPDVPRFHPKVYVFGSELALVTSANLTRRALDSNIEVGTVVGENEARALASWFDQQWESATPVDLPAIVRLNQQTAALRIKYAAFRTDCRRLCRPAAPDASRGISTPSVSYFLCNSNRPTKGHFEWDDRHIESLMKKRNCAAAWEEFNYRGHMRRVRQGDIILLFANGGVGIIAIGQAKGECETLSQTDPRRLFNEFDDVEWQFAVDWLIWVEDDAAYRWIPSPRPTFLDISKGEYDINREAPMDHLLPDD
jgi:hypothetical protein